MKGKESEDQDFIQAKSIRKSQTCSGMSGGLGIGVIVTLLGSALPAGHNLGVINTPQHIIRYWILECLAEEYGIKLSPSEESLIWGLTVSAFVGGAFVGSTTGAHLANSIGRRCGLLLIHILSLLSGLTIILCQTFYILEMLLLGRFMAGLAAGAATGLVPLYLSEICLPSWKGVMGTVFPLGLTFGLLFSQILGIPQLLGHESTWAFLIGGHFFYALLSLPLHYFLLPSPTHLYLNKDEPIEAERALTKLRHGDIYTITVEMNLLTKASVEKELQKFEGRSRFSLSNKQLMRSLAAAAVLNLGQQLIGINAIFYYSSFLFMKSGLGLEISRYGSLLAGAANFMMSIFSLPLIKHFRRRSLLLTSISLYMFCQIGLIISLSLIEESPYAGYMAIAAVFAAVVCYGIGMGPVPFMIGTEIFSSETRGLGLAVGGACNWGGNLVVGLLFPSLYQGLKHFSFCVFLVIGLLLFVFVYIVVPETFRKRCEPENESETSVCKTSSLTSSDPNSPLLSMTSNLKV